MLDALGVERADVVGHDWGAVVAWQLAGRRPERVRSLTAVSVPHPAAFRAALADDPDQQRRSRYMTAFLDPEVEQVLLADDAAALRTALQGVPDADLHVRRMQEPGALTAALAYYRALSPADLDGLGPITAPTLYVWSDEDRALGPVPARATGRHVEGPYRFEVLHGVSHWVPEQAADALAGLLLEHLR